MTMSIVDNPRAVIGSNIPDYAAEESARLATEFFGLDKDVDKILDEARVLPPAVEDETTANDYTKTIGRMKDLDDKVEAIRISEGLPYLRRGDAVNSYFFRLRERLARRKKTDKPGAINVLMERLHAYNNRRLEEERQVREKAEREAREAERITREASEKAKREQREAEQKAARARSDATRKVAEDEARKAAEAAAAANAAEDAKRAERQDAEAAAKATPADLTRERHSGGSLNTMRQVGFAEIEDSMKLNPVTLWAFVRDDDKLRALNAWAKVTQFKQQMDGARIGFRNETVIRR